MGKETWGNVSNLIKLAQSKHHTQIVIFLQKVFTFFFLILFYFLNLNLFILIEG